MGKQKRRKDGMRIRTPICFLCMPCLWARVVVVLNVPWKEHVETVGSRMLATTEQSSSCMPSSFCRKKEPIKMLHPIISIHHQLACMSFVSPRTALYPVERNFLTLTSFRRTIIERRNPGWRRFEAEDETTSLPTTTSDSVSSRDGD